MGILTFTLVIPKMKLQKNCVVYLNHERNHTQSVKAGDISSNVTNVGFSKHLFSLIHPAPLYTVN